MSSLASLTRFHQNANIPALGSNSENSLDCFLGVVQFGKDDLVTEGGHVLMRPGVNTYFMTFVVSPHSLERPVQDIGSNEKPFTYISLDMNKER